jgi:uncharacterized protein (TIGR02246 family)
MKPVTALALALAWTALAPAAQAAAPAQDLASARPVIAAANADWVPAMKAHDARRVAAAYADDGLFILPDGKVISGRAAIEASTRARFKPGVTIVGGGLTQDGLVSAAPGLVYEWGHGGLTTRDATGKTHVSSGPYLTVWKRGATGRWAIVRNVVF